jgi:hypothetical protein
VRGLRADFRADFSLGCELDCTEGVDGTDRGAQSGLGVVYDVGESVDFGVAGRRVDDPDDEGEDDTGCPGRSGGSRYGEREEESTEVREGCVIRSIVSRRDGRSCASSMGKSPNLLWRRFTLDC